MNISSPKDGFTLIELSIVLVIIGLIVGGVVVGKTLIETASFRAQISQIQQYNTAVKTFQAKYNCLPGDCAKAAAFGFPARGTEPGFGDGNGRIAGNHAGAETFFSQSGEPTLFWVDLSKANLIPETFNTAVAARIPNTAASATAMDPYLPRGKVAETIIYVTTNAAFSVNYFNMVSVHTGGGSIIDYDAIWPDSRVPVYAADFIDQKMDDGLPTSGTVTARWVVSYSGPDVYWANSGSITYPDPIAPSTNTCFDNANIAGAVMHYSMSLNNGRSNTCTLLFQFQ